MGVKKLVVTKPVRSAFYMSTILGQVSFLCTDILILRMAMRQLTLHGYIHNPLILCPYEFQSETLMMKSSTQRKHPPSFAKAELMLLNSFT